MIVKIPNDHSKSGKIGGNSKPKTYKFCDCCGEIFGPLKTLTAKFCSRFCGYEFQKSKPKKPRLKLNAKARSIQRRSRYLLDSGKIQKKNTCEECGKLDKIEIAHYNYEEAERFRQLCISCHRKWDKSKPKYSGKTAILEAETTKEQ